jgi:Methane oxygenase PmoA
MTRRLAAPALILLLLGHSPLAAQVRFEKRHDAVVIEINGKHFSNFYFGKIQRMPHLHPLRTASGVAVTRGFPVEPLPGDATDRPNHRGLMIGAERVIGPVPGDLSSQLWGWGQNFFDNDPSNAGPDKASIEFKELTGAVGGPDRGTLSMVAHWISNEGQLWLIERRTMTFYAKPADSRMFDIDVELEAAQPVTFTDYQSSGLSIRLDLPFDDHYGGEARIASGGVNEAGARGRRSPWLDWTATLRNGEKAGVAVFDHPKNLNHPTRWQVRGKGFFVANPFAGQVFKAFDPSAASENNAYTMKRGDKLRLRYRVVIHPAERKLDDLLKEFTSQ